MYEYSVDTHNNVTQVCDTDFGTESPTRCKDTTYVTSFGYTNSPVHLRGLVLSETITQYVPTQQVESSVSYEYDSGALTNYASIMQHDPARGVSYTTRGNVTRETRGGSVATITYDIAGNAVSVTTPAVSTPSGPQTGTTTFDFTDQFDNGVTGKNTYAFPTVITDAEGMVQRRFYHWPAGVLLRYRDPNNHETTCNYDDPLDRLRSVQLPRGRTEYAYDDIGRHITTKRRQTDSPLQWVISTLDYDGLGRTISSRLDEGETEVRTDTEYDALGRVWRVSNPTQGTPSEWTTFQYDALDRVTLVTHPDGSEDVTSYANNETLQVDAAGKSRKSIMDGLGRLTTVVEDPGGANYQTTYSHNARDLLRFVYQGSQTREFRYDELGRLIKSIQPESETIDYSYDAAGNLIGRVSNGNTTTLAYDRLNRIRSKTYSGPNPTPAVTWCYDGDTAAGGCASAPSGTNLKGRLTMFSNSVATVRYSEYDVLGRVLAHEVTLAGQPNPFSFRYEYNELALSAAVNPSGRRVSYDYDDAGRIRSVSGLKEGQTTNYAANVTYWPHGALEQMTLGNGLWESWSYNRRLQAESIRVGTSAGAEDRLGLQLWYCPNEAANCTSNNGYVRSQRITIPEKSWLQSYGLPDPLNRLSGVSESGAAPWSRSFDYDRWGNGWVSAWTGFSLDSFTPTGQANYSAQNRLLIQGSGYDSAGNQTAIGGFTFSYDAENRLRTSTINSVTTTYSYDGEGRRVKKEGPGGTWWYVYDAQGQLAAEYGPPAPTGGVRYVSVDHLGSTRLLTKGSGALAERHDYQPFGEELWAGVNGRTEADGYPAAPLVSGTDLRFTGKERDAETGLDYFGARYYSGAQGRFASPDKPFADQHAYDPQSWNLYSYARNNPLRFVDLQGEEVIESRKIQAYRVQGRTASEAFANARQVSGFKSESGETMSGLTSSRMNVINMRVQDSVQPGTSIVDSFAASELVSADVKLDQTITVPEWSERAAATPEEQAAWDAGLAGLRQHEEQHATINRQQAEKLDKSLPGTRGFGEAPASRDAQRKARADLSGKVSGKVRRNDEETKRRQRRLDEETDHGRRQP
jgi:RHS repeat-associated protein